MGPSRFGDHSPGRLVKVGGGDAAFWAFVPDRLPPQLTLDMSLLMELSQADRAVGELEGLGQDLPNAHMLIRPLLRREAVLSSRIEGTQTSLPALFAYEAGQPLLLADERQFREEDTHEVLNYVLALEYGLERVNSLPLSLRLIREVHARLVEGVRGGRPSPGEFRTTPNWIGPPGCVLNDAVFVPPPPEDMTRCLGEFEQYLHAPDDYPPLVRLALIHYQFEAIHPFVDGNGRIGRLLVALLTVPWRLLSQPLLYVSEFFERNRQDYYDHLQAVSEQGAWAPWIRFFLRGVSEQARETVKRLRRMGDLQADWHKRLTGARSSTLLLQLADSLLERPVVTIPRARSILGVTYPSASRCVGKLVEAGILRQMGRSSYRRTYIAMEIIELLGS